jgi:hypothetical protein
MRRTAALVGMVVLALAMSACNGRLFASHPTATSTVTSSPTPRIETADVSAAVLQPGDVPAGLTGSVQQVTASDPELDCQGASVAAEDGFQAGAVAVYTPTQGESLSDGTAQVLGVTLEFATVAGAQAYFSFLNACLGSLGTAAAALPGQVGSEDAAISGPLGEYEGSGSIFWLDGPLFGLVSEDNLTQAISMSALYPLAQAQQTLMGYGVAPLTGTGTSLHGNLTVVVAIAQFADSNLGAVNAPPASFETSIRWGDGTAAVPGLVTVGPAGGWMVSGTHTYAKSGTYTAEVSITDAGGNGLSEPISTTLTVSGGGVTCAGVDPNVTLVGNLTVPAGVTCTLGTGSGSGPEVEGNVQSDGTLIANAATITGNLQGSGGSLSVGSHTAVQGNVQTQGTAPVSIDGATIGGNLQLQAGDGPVTLSTDSIHGNLQVQQLGASDVLDTICGSSIASNLTWQNNGSQVEIGVAAPPGRCTPNTVGGNLQVQSNQVAGPATHAATLYGNTVSGNLQCQGDVPAATSSGDIVRGKIQGECTG